MIQQTLIDAHIKQLLAKVLARQDEAGFFVYPLECDTTITAERILLMHAIDLIDTALQKRLASYLKKQVVGAGWVQYPGGPYDLSASIKAYFALKCAGESADDPLMQVIAEKIRQKGGLRCANVFTRCILAQFGQLSFQETPWMPVELILQPNWSPFSIYKFSCWARAVVVPLSIVMCRKFRANNPSQVDLKELFSVQSVASPSIWGFKWKKGLFYLVDQLGRKLEWLIPAKVRKLAEEKSLEWILQHNNQEDGLGGIYTAMEYEIKALIALGRPLSDPYIQKALEAIRRLEIDDQESTYMQPCVSPVWDTAIAMHALRYTEEKTAIRKGIEWLVSKQLIGILGDWGVNRPGLKGGGWAFQFNNSFYPDLDDTAMCGWAMALIDRKKTDRNIEAAKNWIVGMQSKNGGFAAFNADQNFDYLNLIPFADHGALVDPSTEDVTGRVLSFLGVLNDPTLDSIIQKGVEYLKKMQQPDGSWWGRWGSNYLYGTFSALVGLIQAKVDLHDPVVQKAIRYLLAQQNLDGGWGESCDSYQAALKTTVPSTLFHTSIALIALLSADFGLSDSVERGIEYLLSRGPEAQDIDFNAPGFPRVFYLKYHGYQQLFPLWALNFYKKLR